MNGIATGLFWMAAAALPLATHDPVPLNANSPATVPRPAVIVLWGSWCVSCAKELRLLSSMAPSAKPLPVVTLALDPPERARAALARNGLTGVSAYADDGDIATVLARWGGTALPLAVAIDANGRVCGRKAGLLGTNQLKLWAKQCSR